MNENELRKLLLDWRAVDGDGGPGVRHDRRGAWHLFCHLAAAAALFRLAPRHAAWVGILYDRQAARYYAGMCMVSGGQQVTVALNSQTARSLLAGSECCAYLEGASRGHILDRLARDRGNAKTDDRRQDYNQRINSPRDGGPVWEMWTVSRDIRQANWLGTSIVNAYVDLLEVLGGQFAAVVARGRMEPEYGHMRHLCAMIDAGYVTADDALTDIVPRAIPHHVERLLLRATPQAFAEAATLLVRENQSRCYFMYRRKLSSFAPASLLRRMVITLRPAVRRHGN